MAYFVFPLFLSLAFLFFFFSPPFFGLWSPRETTTIPLGQDDGAVRVPSASSPHICAAFVLGQRKIWNGLLAASGRLMGNEVRGERGHGEVEGIAKGIWMTWCGKQAKGCMWQKTRHIECKDSTDDRVAPARAGLSSGRASGMSPGQQTCSSEGWLPSHAVHFLALGDLWSLASFRIPWLSPEYWCVYPLNTFSLLFFRPFPL